MTDQTTKTIDVNEVMAAVPDEWRAAARQYLAAIAAATSDEERDAIKQRTIDATVTEARRRGWCSEADAALTAAFGEPPDGVWHDSAGLDCRGSRVRMYDSDGYDQDGRNRDGFDREGFTEYGRDRDGYDRDGLDTYGISRDGHDKDGRDMFRFHPHTALDREGFNIDGFGTDGYNRDGFDYRGHDRDGYDAGGFDRNGYDRNGLDRTGQDRYRFGADGYDREGYDRRNQDRDGYYRDYNVERGRMPRLS